MKRFAVALFAGLPTAAVAHWLAFGRGHVMGGAHHLALADAVIALAALLPPLLALLAVYGATRTPDGSVVAARLRRITPPAALLVATTATWFAAIELSEPRHAAVPLLSALAIVLASLAVRTLGALLARVLAHAALAVFAAAPALRRPAAQRIPPTRTPHARSRAEARRLYSRPPPLRA